MRRCEKLLLSIYERKKLGTVLYVFSTISSMLIALVFLAYIFYLAVFIKDYKEALRLVLTAGFPFLMVGFARKIIGAKRPYEVYPFYEECPKRRFFGKMQKDEGGASFPSRHAYSAFVVASTAVFICVPVGAVIAFVAVLMCACRVLLGIHFIRDVLAGAIIGVLAGVLGEFLLRF